ncbi:MULTISPECIES: acetolactate synthase small subunit [Aneurinibacillus]|jgi:acetolactate synthase-1/3 small subunit|uniref:Acetolactate synthase small subunit n=1 Tax=Aneurinibacillus thermoaerophilus TaxID=143495 RepID=A0A1G8D9H7_ANETH|nr:MULTISPECIES: acetolactate synthase small subunit [Aneurinibacillus]AMA72004.1 acetolactate synthase small subunit [Aneurinibacillus sp. XH2]MED0677034.1 acetolactate synthase small subunit [Aneurinibacillus thermoaerophilus]MED0679286.1 acetolactate synthase small subunit [Aneurinibacillus thermoaerophilus]MED0737172.1 acetolactate synthase small subunit [Aneurinibacillus thermoaerophilus]MED0757218.1 acetolactate synthase small subunit [Aneurinibacillus thermoaerophilus]
MEQKHTISILVNDQPGVLTRVASLMGQRGFNIDSITVGQSEEPGLSRMIIVTRGDEKTIEQIMKQFHKLIDVLKVQHLSSGPMVARELALIKVGTTAATRSEINGIIEPFRANIVDVGVSSLVIEVTGSSEKVDALIDLLTPYGIKELSRTGITAISRGAILAKA